MRLKYVYYEKVWDDNGYSGYSDKNWENPIYGNVEGDTCEELMDNYWAAGQNHDLYRFSPREIVGVYD